MTTNNGTELARRYDVVVVGGGVAGLSGALALARARRRVLVVDAGAPRNAPADGVHNFLTRDGVAPAQLLAAGRAEVAGYGGQTVTGTVTAARRADGPDGDFTVELADGRTVRARRLLVTTGLVDELPPVPGLAERWGRDVLHCPYCHGWEVRDQAIAVLATGPASVHQALLWRQWSADVTLLRHVADPPAEPERAQLAARGIAVVAGEVTGVEVRDDRLTGVRLHDGRTVACQALVVAPRFTARAGVAATLGLRPVDERRGEHVIGSRIPADATGATEVPGVWVAGNAADPLAQVVTAAAGGLSAGAAINADLVAEETRLAMAAQAA
ncbi:NAD(P)/FAD-dependent oxidoreductase [Micromonospora sp. NPDC049559]|uniref:NAD(P)/FAD-dependent oxidoreductase n=1 Tax=Micromonospora sp. NPDC049559 TaxID=3155923 RepID=UPI00343D020F